jgi:glycerol-3-phosphate acyltransferase PlsY
MTDIAVVALGYLLGSIPFAFLVARRRGIDLRQVGSLNVGATNVLRTSGVPDAVIAMVLDALKGTAAVLIADRVTQSPNVPVAAGVASVVGHVYPVWLRWRGGKGVATAAGVFGALAPLALLIASAVFVVVAWSTRYISAGSIAAALAVMVATIPLYASTALTAGATLTALVVIHRHRANMARLMAGTEGTPLRRSGRQGGGLGGRRPR